MTYCFTKYILIIILLHFCLKLFNMLYFSNFVFTPGRQQSKTVILSMNVDQKSLETEFLIAICHPLGNKWQLKTLFLAIFDPCPSITKSVFNCRLPTATLSGLLLEKVDPINMHTMNPVLRPMKFSITLYTVKSRWSIIYCEVTGYFYLCPFSESRSSSGSTPSIWSSEHLSVRLSVRLKHFRVPSLCNLYLQKFSFFFIQTLPNDCSHIEDVHLLFCAGFINFLSFLGVLNLDNFSIPMLWGCLVCVICNSKSFHSFLFKLCLMIVHILKMCTFYFVHLS